MLDKVSVNDIMNYENGDMSFDQMIVFFQNLIDTGLVWKLQGHYGRTATSLIDDGHCTYSSV
jgi:hypothetical protein